VEPLTRGLVLVNDRSDGLFLAHGACEVESANVCEHVLIWHRSPGRQPSGDQRTPNKERRLDLSWRRYSESLD
jgi:hypothetical protein